MDDRRFDSLVRALAEGKSRRSVLKGLFGLGGAAAVGGSLLEGPAEAARRPTPTPKPIRCPGNQTPVNGVCTCPTGLSQCNPGVGPACCNSSVAPGSPGYSECCDNACCNGTCYGEELCCRTNSRAGGLPPTNRICDTPGGPECCAYSDECCIVDGCCATICTGGISGLDSCCPAEQFCPGGSGSADLCCDVDETCCGGGTDDNYCANLGAGGCCAASDCPPPSGDACGVECVGGQCTGVTCSEGQICCKGECVSSSIYVRCPADPDECCNTSLEACCGAGGCCIEEVCNPTAGVCCTADQTPCGSGADTCCDSPDSCCGGTTCCAPGSCTTAGECCSGDDIFCANECCPEERCTPGVGCCSEGFLACGTICCKADVYQCAAGGQGCECLPGTEGCGLSGGCCPEGQCNTDAGECCVAGTSPCGSVCCANGLCDDGVCTCSGGLVRCSNDACQECCGSVLGEIDNCQVLYGYDLNCVFCPNGVCDTSPFNGAMCETDGIGALGKCDDGFCIPCGGGAGAPCEQDTECCSGVCQDANGQCTDP